MSTPLFPLPNIVLLPGLVLPLYVFEPRYRELLGRVRDSREPFGIVRLLPGEPGAPLTERVGRVGSFAHLREVIDHEDGTASILVLGGERFEVERFDESQSYLSAAVREAPLGVGDDVVLDALPGKVLDRVVNLHQDEAEVVRDRAPRDPLFLATYCAALMPLTGEQREQVLCAPTLSERFEVLASLMPDRILN